MSGIELLLGLLVAAYVGNMLVGGRTIRGYGLPSGTEYLLLGFVLGPHVFDLAPREVVEQLQPLALVLLGWLALVVGVDYGVVKDRRVRVAIVLAGVASALVTALVVAGCVWLVCRHVLSFSRDDAMILAGAMGLVLCETTRHAVRWVVERYAAEGPLADLLGDLSDADDAVPLVLMAVLFAFAPGGPDIGLGLRIGLPLGAGVTLGLIAALLLRYERRLHESWGLLLGIALLGIGVASRVELSTLSLAFAMGVTLVVALADRAEIRAMVDATERPVLLPVLLLAGASIDLRVGTPLLVVAAVGLLARLLGKQLVSIPMARARGARPARAWLGLAALPAGAVTMSLGLACRYRLDGPLGDAVLLAAAASVLLGELLGPLAVRQALLRSGEIVVSSTDASDGRAERTTEAKAQ